MTPLPVSICAQLLGVHPKTLHGWLKAANLPLVAHPTDARIRCVELHHLQEVARRHDRVLPPQASALVPPMASVACSSPTPAREPDLLERLAALETQVATLHEHLAQLAFQLLREREVRYEQRLSALEALIEPEARPSFPLQELASPQAGQNQTGLKARLPRPLLPAEQRARARVIALIEYGAQGSYVAVCPQEGVLGLVPDSQQWFDWLASLHSFRFVGQQGRFTACRDTEHGQYTRLWRASRSLRGRHYKSYLGTTDRLTITHLEQAAAELHSHLTTL